MSEYPAEIVTYAEAAWFASVAGDVEESKRWYRKLDGLMPHGTQLNPNLSVLRHNLGTPQAGDYVVPIPATEDRVSSFGMGDGVPPTLQTPFGQPFIPSVAMLKRGIDEVYRTYAPGIHAENSSGQIPHILTMSTGRCGTMSLMHLFRKNPSLLPYHTYWWASSRASRIEMMCRIWSGVPSQELEDAWAATRAAEWLGAEGNGRVMVGMNHLDTIWAPVFAKIHPKGKFLHLRRDPEKVFDSFLSKTQWASQLGPVEWTFADGFHWNDIIVPLPHMLAWYIRFTEVFGQAMEESFPDRCIRISSDRLFERDVAEIEKLSQFVGVHIDPDHFTRRINAKDHKVTWTESDLQIERNSFRISYRHFGGTI